MSAAAGPAAAQVRGEWEIRGEAQFQDWNGKHREWIDVDESWDISTDGRPIKSEGPLPRGFGAWLRVQYNIPLYTVEADPMVSVDSLLDVWCKFDMSISFTHAVTTAEGWFRRPRLAAEGYVAKTWLVRLDWERAEWMGFANYRVDRHGFNWLSPSNIGHHPKIFSGLMEGRLHEWNEFYGRKFEDVRTLSVDDLKRAKRLRIEVGSRPEDQAEVLQLTNDNTAAGTVVVEFSLKGSARAIEWAYGNCRNALGRLVESTG